MLTLITATLNAARYLEQALASVPPTDAAIQHIVVDGGSTDGTVELCRARPRIEVVVAPGSSIYQAWNIGIERAGGDWVMFLNADDELAPDTPAIVAATAAGNPDAAILAGRAELHLRGAPGAAPTVWTAAPGGRLEVGQLALGVPAINAMAFRRALFERYGRFDTVYRIAGDRAWLLRLALNPSPPVVGPVDAVLYRYFSHAGSLTLMPSLEQRLRIARDHLPLATQLLAQHPSAPEARVLRYWRRREAVVVALRCAAAGRAVAACRFAAALFDDGAALRPP